MKRRLITHIGKQFALNQKAKKPRMVKLNEKESKYIGVELDYPRITSRAEYVNAGYSNGKLDEGKKSPGEKGRDQGFDSNR